MDSSGKAALFFIFFQKASSLSTPGSIMSETATRSFLDVPNPRSPQLSRKPSVRFAEKPNNDGVDPLPKEEKRASDDKEPTKEDYLEIPVKIAAESMRLNPTETLDSDSIPTELVGQLLVPKIDVPPELAVPADPVIVSIVTDKITKFNKEFSIRKNSETEETSRTLPFVVAKMKLTSSFLSSTGSVSSSSRKVSQ